MLKSSNYSLVDTSFIGEPIDHDIPSPSIPLNHGFGLSSNDGGYHHQQTHNDKHIDILRPFKPQKDTGRGKGNVGSRVNHPRKICTDILVISRRKRITARMTFGVIVFLHIYKNLKQTASYTFNFAISYSTNYQLTVIFW